jgi:hypothetical protein
MLKSKSGAGGPPRNGRRRLCYGICVIVTIVIGLALGLGLGLGLAGKKKEKEEEPFFPSADHNPNWKPATNTTWQIVLNAPLELEAGSALEPDVEAYDIDLFTNGQEVIDELHHRGKKVICYFSAGSYEPDRPDSGEFPEEDLGSELDGWPGERWLKLSSNKTRDIMAKRIKIASDKKCDAIDPDNVDGYVSVLSYLCWNDKLADVSWIAKRERFWPQQGGLGVFC